MDYFANIRETYFPIAHSENISNSFIFLYQKSSKNLQAVNISNEPTLPVSVQFVSIRTWMDIVVSSKWYIIGHDQHIGSCESS